MKASTMTNTCRKNYRQSVELSVKNRFMEGMLTEKRGFMMKKKILITGFEPFGKDTVNASWEAVSRLEDRIGDLEVTKLLIPTVFGEAAEKVLEAARELQPDVILCVGQAGNRTMVTPEMVAINLRDASIEDNAGKKPQEEPVVPGGPTAYFSSICVRKIVETVRSGGIDCGISYSAGAYVCNDLFYSLRHHYEGSGTGVGFIHVPCLAKQGEGKGPGLPEQHDGARPGMPLEDIVQALRLAVGAL